MQKAVSYATLEFQVNMNKFPYGSHSDASNKDSIPETTRQMKYLKAVNKSIKRGQSKKKSKLITWGDISTLTHQAETLEKQENNITDPKMMLLCLLTVLHANSQLVNAEFKCFL
ncbi:MAPK-interacting and spindle-stabilizing protein-like [Peromyscus leucopus]|uniref:MAPK-interacting and spindle-stabilizing protein-like n=1 Tax=Peromyscus leucopus TaxID=10041 RepID=UPI0010A12E4B|nr:MAPK-interacting and spindle-stabilizing protein-like [Peromyscus leucopus]